jgi:hypothetical protein
VSDPDEMRYEAEKEKVDEAYAAWFYSNETDLLEQYVELHFGQEGVKVRAENFNQFCRQQWNEYMNVLRRD